MKRNSVEIRVWMIRNRVRVVDIEKALGYKDCKTVRDTLNGSESNRRVLTWLVDHGCPVKLLALPDDMRVAA